ncbi:MAG: hypothetical protein ACKV2U_04105 [Bryobacteraceae bacterium]
MRRLKDAEFCSDAHRFSNADEQQLAMRRLAETQPALQRTQRMAVAAPGQMNIVAGLVQFVPLPIAAIACPRTVPEQLYRATAFLFRDREIFFQAGMPWCSRSLRLPAIAAVQSRVPTTQLSQLPQLRITIPPDLASRPTRKAQWCAAPARVLLALACAPITSRVTVARSPTLEQTVDLQWTPRPHRRRNRELIPTLRLSRLLMAASGDGRTGKRFDSPLFLAGTICWPVSRLTALTSPQAAQNDDSPEEFWAILEASPLGCLVAATHCLTVEPISCEIGAPINSPESSTAAYPSPALAFPGALDIPGTVSRRLPAPGPRPVRPPAYATLRCRIGDGPAILEPRVSRQLPKRQDDKRSLSLIASDRILSLRPPAVVTGNRVAGGDGTWASQLAPQVLSAWGVWRSTAGLANALGTAVPAPDAAGASAGVKISPPWFTAVVSACRPSSRTTGVGRRFTLAGNVRHDLRPGQVDSPLPPYSAQPLQTILRFRLPLHSPPLLRRHLSAECVPLSPPQNQPLAWRAALVGGTDLYPDQILPARPKQADFRAPRGIPIRLFQVPRAKPMARPASGRPLCCGLDQWRTPPAICGAGLPFDDGRRGPEHLSPRGFGRRFRERFSQFDFGAAWMRVARPPANLKWIAMAVPLAIGIWVLARPFEVERVNTATSMQREERPASNPPIEVIDTQATVAPVSVNPPRPGKSPVRSPRSRESQQPAAATGGWDAFTARISSRASVNLLEDFRNGLSQWDGRGEWARSWSYDRSGTVRPGQMAIFQPSIGLRDYVMEMKASIDRRAIQWIVRASGPKNYHFARLNVTPGAPLTKLEFERWSVIDGRPGRVTRLPLPHGGANQTLYAIRVEVKGDSFTTYLQDQVIDTFNDPRLREGGVGLIGGADDRPRIYGVHVFHQNDFLGKLCSFLAPQPINSQGSD